MRSNHLRVFVRYFGSLMPKELMDKQLCSSEFHQSLGNQLVLRFSEILNRFFKNPIASSSKLRTRPRSPHPFDYNKLMKEFNQAGQIDQVIRLFQEMKELNLHIDVVCYTTAMDSLVISNRHEQALAIFEEMLLDNIAPDTACCTVLVKMYSLYLKQFDSAFEVIQWMRNCGCFPDVVTYTTLILGLCWDGRVEEAFGVLDYMLEAECMPNVYTYTPIIHAYCSMGRIQEAKRLIKTMEDAGCLPNNVTFNILIEALCKIGAFDEVDKVLEESKMKKWKPDEITYSIYMNGLCKWCKVAEAFGQLDFMLGNGLVPNAITLNILLDCLCNSSLALEAKSLLEKSFELEWDVNVFNYNTVMRTLCDDGKYWAVLKLFADMLKKNIAANAWTLSIVIHSLCKAGKLQNAKCILDGEGSEANAVAYSTLIHYFYMNEQIDEVYLLYSKMALRNIAPNFFIYGIMIGCLCRQRYYRQAIYCFLRSLEQGMSEELVAKVIYWLIRRGKIRYLLNLCDYIVDYGVNKEFFVYDSIIRVFCKMGYCQSTEFYVLCFILDKMLSIR